MATEAPRIETARLVLRSIRAEDLDAHAAMLGDPEVMRYLGTSPLSREESWRKLLTGPGLWSLLGYGYWAVERREDGAYLGQLGFADFQRDGLPQLHGLPEMGWLFARAAQGQGYASEGVAAALAWADEHLRAAVIPAIIHPDNAPSIRLAERNGFVIGETAAYRGEPTLVLRRAAAP